MDLIFLVCRKAISGLLNEEVADMVTEFDEVILILSDDDLQKLSCKKT